MLCSREIIPAAVRTVVLVLFFTVSMENANIFDSLLITLISKMVFIDLIQVMQCVVSCMENDLFMLKTFLPSLISCTRLL